MGIQFNFANLEIDGVQAIVVSTIQPDPNSDLFVRLIQVFDKPTSTTPAPLPVLTLTLKGGSQSVNDQSELKVQIPPVSQD